MRELLIQQKLFKKKGAKNNMKRVDVANLIVKILEMYPNDTDN